MNKDSLQELALSDLMPEKTKEGIDRAAALYQKAQESMYVLAAEKDEADLTQLKIGTVLALSVLRKIAEGTMPVSFTPSDWEEIAHSVADYAVLTDGCEYSVFIFTQYADYIQLSASYYDGLIPKEKIHAITDLAEELRAKSDSVQRSEITEPRYVEDCMWICLEAILKLLSSMLYLTGKTEAADATQAAVMLAYEYGRLKLYAKEQALLTEYIENQYQLDEDLQEKFNAFKEELSAETEQFETLINQAFDPNFRDTLMASAELARRAGVKEEEILKSVEDVDDFFLD